MSSWLMGLFIEEEGKSYINAADMYFQYLFKRINIHTSYIWWITHNNIILTNNIIK